MIRVFLMALGIFASLYYSLDFLQKEGSEFEVVSTEEYTNGHTMMGLGALWDNRQVILAKKTSNGRMYTFEVPIKESLSEKQRFVVWLGQVHRRDH